MIRIPVYQPALSGNERAYVDQCLDSGWISSKGEFIERFETAFAALVQAPFAASVCNGTVALHVAMVALGLGPGDEVIVPTLTYIASVNAITYVGATPVLVDSLPDTWQMDPEDIRRKLTARTRAIEVVHLYGHPCDMDAILKLAEEFNLFVIEDCAEAFGASYHGRPVGSFGEIAAYSLFGNKTITTGEGGMVTTQEGSLHDRVLRLKGQGLAKFREYWHDIVGFNFRMTNICAAIGLAQTEQAQGFLARKAELAVLYRTLLSDLPQVSFQVQAENVVHSHWMVTILVEAALTRTALRDFLAASGIETRPVFYPVHLMPPYGARYQKFPVAEDIARRGINLPSFPALEPAQVREICALIHQFFNGQS